MSTNSRTNSRANFNNEIHDIGTVQNSTMPPTYYDRSLADIFPPHLLKKVVSEVVSTFLLVFVTCGAAGIYGSDKDRISQLGQSVAGGLIVTVMIYAVGHISGAHMNPAVTLAFAVFRHFPWIQVPFYWAAQFTGAICASFVLKAVLHPISVLGCTTPTGPHWHSLIIEIIVTFNMMFVTLAVATDTRAVGELAGLAVGSSVCITSIFAGAVSGGSMNPARTLGPALASNLYTGLWIYFLGPVLGTLSGAWTAGPTPSSASTNRPAATRTCRTRRSSPPSSSAACRASPSPPTTRSSTTSKCDACTAEGAHVLLLTLCIGRIAVVRSYDVCVSLLLIHARTHLLHCVSGPWRRVDMHGSLCQCANELELIFGTNTVPCACVQSVVRVPSTVPLLLSLVQKPVGAYINIICAFHDKILLPSLVISAKESFVGTPVTS